MHNKIEENKVVGKTKSMQEPSRTKKQRHEFAGLSNYILSEINSSGDEGNRNNLTGSSSPSSQHSSDSSVGSEKSFVG